MGGDSSENVRFTFILRFITVNFCRTATVLSTSLTCFSNFVNSFTKSIFVNMYLRVIKDFFLKGELKLK